MAHGLISIAVTRAPRLAIHTVKYPPPQPYSRTDLPSHENRAISRSVMASLQRFVWLLCIFRYLRCAVFGSGSSHQPLPPPLPGRSTSSIADPSSSVNRALRCRERRLMPGRRSRSFQERDYWTCPQFGGGPASAPVGPVHALKLSAMYDGVFCTPQEKRSPRRPPLANVESVAVMLAPPTSCRLRLEPPT